MRTMKIEEDVAVRLGNLKKHFKLSTYSILLESFCDFFETTRLKPTDLDNSRKPPSVVITERTNTILGYIKTQEKNHIKPMQALVEKIFVLLTENDIKIGEENEVEKVTEIPQNLSDKEIQIDTKEIERLVAERTKKLSEENKKLTEENGQIKYKIEHQKKFVKELLSKMSQQKLNKTWTIPNNEFQYYKEELEKL